MAGQWTESVGAVEHKLVEQKSRCAYGDEQEAGDFDEVSQSHAC
jgi:hypothetical protein